MREIGLSSTCKIGLANWTPEDFIGQLFKTVGKHLPPSGAKSPARWGTRAGIAELLERRAASVETAHKHFVFRYRSPEHWLEVFKTYYRPGSPPLPRRGTRRWSATSWH